jgi:hypothetical protein
MTEQEIENLTMEDLREPTQNEYIFDYIRRSSQIMQEILNNQKNIVQQRSTVEA